MANPMAAFVSGKPIFVNVLPASSYNAGDVVVYGNVPYVAHEDNPPYGSTVALDAVSAMGGIYQMAADAAYTNGQPVLWNPTAQQVTQTAVPGTTVPFGIIVGGPNLRLDDGGPTGAGGTCAVLHLPTLAIQAFSNLQTQFGSGSATMLEEGNIYRYAGSGLQPASTGGDIVVAAFSLPANSLDGTGFRGLNFSFSGNFANNAHTKECKIIVNPSTAVVGSAVGSGGTTIADTGASTAANVGWSISGQVFKYGAKNSNTQVAQETGTIVGGTHGGCGLASLITATENAAILVAFTINCTTTATDATGYFAEINAMN